MAVVEMPQLGETITEGTVIRWLKAAGESVALDEPLCEIETETETETPIDTEPGILPTLASIQENVFALDCARCHFPGGGTPLQLTSEELSYQFLVTSPLVFACFVPRVTPFEPENSCLVWSLEESFGTPPMPKDAPRLSQEKIDAIREWIRLGALP